MKNMTDLEQALQEYLRLQESLNFSVSTVKCARNDLKMFISFLAENYSIGSANSILQMHLLKWHQSVCEHRTREGLPLKAGSLNKRIERIRGFLRFLARNGQILPTCIDVLKSVRMPKLLPRKTYDHHTIRQIFEAIDISSAIGFRDRTILELMYSSGLRAVEVIALDIRDIDLDLATALINGKGQKQRLVPIGRTALKFLREYLSKKRILLLQQDSEILFPNGIGTRMSYRTLLTKVVNRHCKGPETGENPGTHIFRRSCATEMIRGGANLYHIKEILGHESLETIRHYTKLTITDLQQTHAKTHPRG